MRVLYPGWVEIWSVTCSFCGGRKTGEPGEKPLEQGREPTRNSTHIWHRAGIEPGPHWWEASALTTAPSLLPSTNLIITCMPRNHLQNQTSSYTYRITANFWQELFIRLSNQLHYSSQLINIFTWSKITTNKSSFCQGVWARGNLLMVLIQMFSNLLWVANYKPFSGQEKKQGWLLGALE